MLVNLLALLLCLTFTVQADDTELFVKILPGESKPNVLLLIDTSLSMKAIAGNRKTVCETKRSWDLYPQDRDATMSAPPGWILSKMPS